MELVACLDRNFQNLLRTLPNLGSIKSQFTVPLGTLPFHTGDAFCLRNQINALAPIPEDLQKEGYQSIQCDTRDVSGYSHNRVFKSFQGPSTDDVGSLLNTVAQSYSAGTFSPVC